MENTYRQFTPGQLVVTCFGQVRTVLLQRGCQVFVRGECGTWYHPAKLFPFDLQNNPSCPASADLTASARR